MQQMDFICLYYNVHCFYYRMAYSLDLSPDTSDNWNDPFCDICYEVDNLNVKAASFCMTVSNLCVTSVISFMKGLTLPEDMLLKQGQLCQGHRRTNHQSSVSVMNILNIWRISFVLSINSWSVPYVRHCIIRTVLLELLKIFLNQSLSQRPMLYMTPSTISR